MRNEIEVDREVAMQASDFDANQNPPNPQQTLSRIPRVAIVGTGFVGSAIWSRV